MWLSNFLPMTFFAGADHAAHHHLAVGLRELLRPAHRADVVAEVLRAFLEIGEVRVGQVGLVLHRVLLRQFDEHGADRVAHAARTRVQHEPHETHFIQADLDEVVARPERAQVLVVVGVLQLRVVAADLGEVGLEFRPGRVDHLGRVLPRADVAALGRAAVRHGGLDRGTQRAQVVRQVLGAQRGLAGHHPAADVDADRGRDDRLQRRDHRAHRRADAQVHVGHRRDVLEHDRQLRRIHQLLAGFVLHGHALASTSSPARRRRLPSRCSSS